MGNYPFGQFPIFFILSNKDRKEKNKMSTNNNRVINDCRFYPVQGPEEVISNLAPQEGYVYFTTDTKKIFLGQKNEKIPMCQASGFFYGIKEIEYDNSGVAPDPNVTFLLDEIEGNEVPEIDDLILNKDGCFYRVKVVEDNVIDTIRLTLQGTGGGGGGTDPSPSGGSYNLVLASPPARGTLAISSEATTIPIELTCFYDGERENYITEVSFSLSGQEAFYTYSKAFDMNVKHTIDLIEYKDLLRNHNGQKINISTTDMYGNSRGTYFFVNVVTLTLRATASPIIVNRNPVFAFECNITGGTGDSITTRELIYSFYKDEQMITLAMDPIVKDIGTFREGNIPNDLNISALAHGAYMLGVQAKVTVPGGKTIYSNTLVHKLNNYINATSSAPMLAVLPPAVTEQYTEFEVPYLLSSREDDVKEYNLVVTVDGKEHDKLTIIANQPGSCKFYFETVKEYAVQFTAQGTGQMYATKFNITKYTGNIPTIDAVRSDLMLYLNPRGQSNNSTSRDSWWDYNKRHKATLENLFYGTTNGWMYDNDNVPYLKLSSGATFKMPTFKPFEKDLTRRNIYGQTPGYGFTIELDIELSGILDYQADLISCVSATDGGVIQCGFTITGEKAYLFNNVNNTKDDALVAIDMIENERVRLSFAVEPNNNSISMVNTYLNGIVSSIERYDNSSYFEDSVDNAATLVMDSANATIKIYGIRFYSSALSSGDILNNFTASLPTLADREEKYESNLVLDPVTGKVSLSKVSAQAYDLTIPYMLITGGMSCDKKFKLDAANQSTTGLPTGKKTYKLIDCEIKYPKTALFNGYKDYACKCEFASGKPMHEAFGEAPTRGAMMYAQGTSSMEYPVKNLRIKFKNEDDYIQVRPDLAPVEIICMKADFMESSGSHNTGAANLVDQLYENLGISTPGQQHFDDGEYKTVTAIKGYPCLIFYSKTGERDSYEFIGKYNLNLDKATPEPFGFDHDDSDFGYLPEGYPYYEIDYDDGDYDDTREGEELKEVQTGEKINSIHCFEFLDNNVKVCNFLGKAYEPDKDKEAPKASIIDVIALVSDDYKPNYYYLYDEATNDYILDASEEFDPSKTYYSKYYDYEETWYNTFVNADGESVPGWSLGFESRYPEDKIGYHDADMLYPFASWINDLYNMRYGKGPKYPEPDEAGALARFKNEYQCYLDKDFTLTYHLLTEALLMADSRVKNMMIATWGPEKRKYKDYITGEEKESFNYIFYPIFYDMDTMLGLNNYGAIAFKYYAEDTDPDIFNGNEILWNFVRDALGEELNKHYSTMEQKLLSPGNVLNFFSTNQANLANEAFYNADAQYKYVRPFKEGYTDDSKKPGDIGYQVDPGKAKFMYAAQGSRDTMRRNFVIDRLKFLSGKYQTTNFKTSDRIDFRFNAPSASTPDEDLRDSISVVPASSSLRFEGVKVGYAAYMIGANASSIAKSRVEPDSIATIIADGSGAGGTEAYILGVSNLSDMGDLSNKYLQKFVVSSDQEIRLKKLQLGSPYEKYDNIYWGNEGSELAIGGFTHLEEFNLQNCPKFTYPIDFSQCLAIRKIFLTGSSVTSITLPPNSIIQELRLPETIGSLMLNNCNLLTDEYFSMGGYQYNNTNTNHYIGEEGSSYLNDFSNLTTVSIINTPINSYEIIRGAINLQKYCLQNVEWHIEENDIKYRYAGKIENNDNNIIYYYRDGDNFVKYEGSYPSTINLYTKHTLVNADGKITEIPVLEFLLGRGTIENIPVAQALTGKIIIDVEGMIDDLQLSDKYMSVFPNLEITYGSKPTVDMAYDINFYYGLDAESMGDTDISNIGANITFKDKGERTLAEIIGNTELRPYKDNTPVYNYYFSGRWFDWNSAEKPVYYQDYRYTEYGTGTMDTPAGEYYYWDVGEYKLWDRDLIQGVVIYTRDIPDNSFLKYKPTAQMDLVPEFISDSVKYQVTCIDGAGNGTFRIFTYDEPFSGYDEPTMRYVAKSCTGLADDEHYVFRGWITEKDHNDNNPNPTLIDLTKLRITEDMTIYSYFTVEKIAKTSAPTYLFNIRETQVSINGKSHTLMSISLNDDFAWVWGSPQGDTRIVLPTHTSNGTAIKVIGNFATQYQDFPVNIYFTEGSEYEFIQDGAFADNTQVYEVHLPDTIKAIGDRAFYGAKNVIMSELPTGLTTLGKQAFTNAEQITISKLPVGIDNLGLYTFVNCHNLQISSIGEEGNEVLVGNAVFMGAKVTSVTSFTFGPRVTIAEMTDTNGIFHRAYPNLNTVICYNYAGCGSEEELRYRLYDNESRSITIMNTEFGG